MFLHIIAYGDYVAVHPAPRTRAIERSGRGGRVLRGFRRGAPVARRDRCAPLRPLTPKGLCHAKLVRLRLIQPLWTVKSISHV